MLGAHRLRHSQFTDHSHHFYCHIRAVRPVAQVFRKCFFTTVDDSPNGYLRHNLLPFYLYILNRNGA